MEGDDSKSLPKESGSKGSSTRLIAAVIVVILVVAAVGGAILLMGGSKSTENKAPTAVLSTTAAVVNPGESVLLNATGSSDPDGKIVKFVWMFGDGSFAETKTATTTHAFSLPGVYAPVVTVVDEKGLSASSWSAGITIQVNPPATPDNFGNDTKPVPIVAVSDSIITNNKVVSFNGLSSYGFRSQAAPFNGSAQPGPGEDVRAVVWNFGDGSPVVGGPLAIVGVLNHTYTGNGTLYVMSFTVISTHNAVQTFQQTIMVTPTGGGGTGGVKHPETFTKATFGEPQSLDPAWDYESAGGEVLSSVYETLVAWNADGSNLEARLATAVPTIGNGITPDGKNYTFTLRSGVKFHDGNVMTADDVIYSIKRVLIMNDAEGAAWMLGQVMLPSYPGLGKATNLAEINASMTKNSASSVTFHLFTPYAAFLQVMAYTVASVTEATFVQAHGGGVFGEKNTFMNRNEMGTGPFKLKQWATNQRIIMERFADYWGGAAKLKYVIIVKVQDTSTREMMLLSGEADNIVLAQQNKADVLNKPGVFVKDLLPTFTIGFFGPNENIKPGLDIGNVPATFFADKNVRLAFVHAFDYATFLHDVALDTAIQPNGPIPKGMLGYSNDTPVFDFNLTKTANYLKAAPDTRPGNTGSYADNGFSIVLYYNAGNTGRQAGCQLLKRGLESLSQNASAGVSGAISVSIQAMDWPAYLDARAASKLPIFFMAWAQDYPDPDDFANPFCHQNGSFPIFMSIQNNSLTHLVENAAKELNMANRVALYHQIAQSCYDNAYYLWTTQPTAMEVHRTWVQGWIYNPTYSELPGNYYPLFKALLT